MFRRLILEHWMSLFTLVAFSTALSIYLTCAWRALRMPREQRERFARLPLADDETTQRKS
ncbi:MAG: hypothetical protein MUE42_02155 [Opitutaceae bacterium]|jgi:hypothetical protein|nr:hypothetical protein [Opitutaceae bacterium]